MPTFWLHYVGTRLYRRSNLYRIEFRRHGVQRAVPFNLLGSMEFGTPVLLAFHNRQSKTATVIGYFRVEAVVNNLPAEVKDDLHRHLNILDLDLSVRTVERACGTYTIGAVVTVDETLQSILQKVRQVCQQHNIVPTRYKWFIHGRYHPLHPPIHLKPVNFTRGYMKVEIKDFSLAPSTTPHYIYWIFDYRQRAYLPRKELAKLSSRRLSEYLEGEE